MAVDHFNARDPSVVPQLSLSEYASCDPLLAAAASVDNQGMKAVAAMLVHAPSLCGVVGPYYDKSIAAAGVVAGAMDTPVLSYHAASQDLGKNHVLPLTAKVIADEYARAEVLLDYIVEERGRDYVTLLYWHALTSVHDVLESAVSRYQRTTLTTLNVNYVVLDDKADAKSEQSSSMEVNMETALQKIFDSGYKTIVVALSRKRQWDFLFKVADRLNMTDPANHYVWMAHDNADLDGLVETKKSVARARLLHGMGTVRVLDGFQYQKADPFLEGWRALGNNSSFVARLNNINPIVEAEDRDQAYVFAEDDYFDTTDPAPYSGYVYDATIALGMGRCRATAAEKRGYVPPKAPPKSPKFGPPHYPDTGQDSIFYNKLVEVNFTGATGDVVLHDGHQYTRNATTMAYGVYNLRHVGGAHKLWGPQNNSSFPFKYVLTAVRGPYRDDWTQVEGRSFLFANDMAVEPSPLRTPTSNNLVVVLAVTTCVAVLGSFWMWLDYKKKRSDSVWTIQRKELVFDDPPEVIGEGTFGLVHLAEYRGTQVAVKRVIPSHTRGQVDSRPNGRNPSAGPISTKTEKHGSTRWEAKRSTSIGKLSGGLTGNTEDSSHDTRSGSSRYSLAKYFGHGNMRQDFITEMRQLSILRHPCITTVMGAVIAPNEEPLLVMEYMENGSLHDLLRNETLVLEGELLLPILRDISQGVRFLHAASPQVLHADLKAKNILVDSKFRVKVADFGLSQKKRVGAAGTPYWMAPELLRREGPNTDATDVYAFGIILYEVYSRKDPYEGENYEQVLRQVADPAVNKRPELPPLCPPQVRSLMADCLEGEPDNRPSFEEIDVRLKRLSVETVEPTKFLLSKQSKKEQRFLKTESLLFDIFPRHIAEALRDGRKVEAESREVVTIFFSDIVGFTDISSSLTPIKVSDMLDRLYNRFDELSQVHDVFKVETIGDAYMAVT